MGLGRASDPAYARHMTSRFVISLFIAAQVLTCGGEAWAATAPAAPLDAPALPDASPKPEEAGRAEVLNTLFGKLAQAKSAPEAKAIEAAIYDVWMRSGSPSVDLLMGRGLDAFGEKNYDRALFYFNEVVALDPNFVEGWDKRAAIFFLKDDYASALKDIEHVLKLEPRHFGAMGGLAVILQDLGDKKGALDIYRRALKLDPWFDGAAEAEKSLSIDIEGRGI